MVRFEVYTDAEGDGRWRLVSGNGRIIADGGEGYSRVRDAERAVARIQRVATAVAGASVGVLTTSPSDLVRKRSPGQRAEAVQAAQALRELVVALGGAVR